MQNVRVRVALVVLIANVAVPALALAKDVLRCGQRVGKYEVGVVLVDIACPSEVGSCNNDDSIECTSNNSCPVSADGGVGICGFGAVQLEKGTRLLLRGHTLSTSAAGNVALITEAARIEGPGTITAPGGTGILLGGGGKLVLRSLVIRDGGMGIYLPSAKATIEATDVSIVDNARGGIANAKQLKGSNIVVSGNGLDPGVPRSSVIGAGIQALAVRVDGLTAEGNGGPGVDARVVRLKNSSVTGNDGFLQGVDIAARRKPKLTDSTCGASGRLSDSGALLEAWGVCASD